MENIKNARVFIVPATSSAFTKYIKDYYCAKKGEFNYMSGDRTRTTGNTDYWNVYDINFVDENDKIIASTNKSLNLPGIPAAWIDIILVPNKGKITDVKLEMEAKYDTETFTFSKYGLVFDDYGAVVVVSSVFNAEKLPNVNPEEIGFVDRRIQKPDCWTSKNMVDFAEWLHKLDLDEHDAINKKANKFLSYSDYLEVWKTDVYTNV